MGTASCLEPEQAGEGPSSALGSWVTSGTLQNREDCHYGAHVGPRLCAKACHVRSQLIPTSAPLKVKERRGHAECHMPQGKGEGGDLNPRLSELKPETLTGKPEACLGPSCAF